MRMYLSEQKEEDEWSEKIWKNVTGVDNYQSTEPSGDDSDEDEVNQLATDSSSGIGAGKCLASGSQPTRTRGPRHKGVLDNSNPPNFDENVDEKMAKDIVYGSIALFLYESGIPLNCVKTPSFVRMFEAVAAVGEPLELPSYDMWLTMLQERVKSTKYWIDSFKVLWENYGCSIMADWWMDGNNKTLINFLVNCPKGTVFLKSIDASECVKDSKLILGMLKEVIEEVGEKNVVQVVTDNASNFKLAGKWLMEEKHMFWTPCAAHCVDLMCQDIINLPMVNDVVRKSKAISSFLYNHARVLHLVRKYTGGRDLVRPAITKSATSFLSMECILNHKASLRSMVHSKEWTESKWMKHPDGKRLAKTIRRSTYWNKLRFALKILAPLVDVIRLINTEEKPCMGYIYRAMADCKKKIEANLGPKEKALSKELHRIIEHRWIEQLHHPLYAAGYYLNPSIYFDASTSQSEIEADDEVKLGLFKAIDTLVVDEKERERVIEQLVIYREASGLMGMPIAVKQRNTMDPFRWWITWGSCAPDLQKFAKRVLSLTCAASPFERNKSAINNLHSKIRNRLEHQELIDLVYVQYNSKLIARYEDRTSLTGRDTDPIITRSEEDCEEWIEPYDAASDRVGDTAFTYGLLEEAKGEDSSGPSTGMRHYKRRRVQQQSQSQSQRRGRLLELNYYDSETEDDEEAELDEGISNDDGLLSGDDEDIDF